MAFACFYLVITLSLFPLTFGSLLCPIDYIYQLGDSTADTGNLILVLPFGPSLPAALLPYGETFPGTPSGRWGDGRLIIDYIASALDLPLLNPYLDTNASFDNGVNFAVAGATALDNAFLAAQGIIVPSFTGSLNLQLQQFLAYLNSTCASRPDECARMLKRALVIVGDFGSNDINFGLTQGRSVQEIRNLVPLITNTIINATREVVRIGAVRVVVPGNFPIGCFPTFLNLFNGSDPSAYDNQGCLRTLNELVLFQNSDLRRALALLRLEFRNVDIVYSDNYNPFQRIFRAAHVLGFDRRTLLKACCGNGTFGTCATPAPGAALCSDPARYLSWDGQHFTQEAYHRIADLVILDETVYCAKDISENLMNKPGSVPEIDKQTLPEQGHPCGVRVSMRSI